LNNVALHLPAPGATFAGRDIFAPVAAHLCSGVPFDELGDAVDADLLMPGLVTLPQIGDTEIISEVTWVDHFGNCQLNVGLEDVATLLSGGSLLLSLVVDGVARSATITTAFGLIPSGGIGLVIDSYGMLAIAKDQDSAARDVGVGVGDQVVLRAGEASQVSTAVHIGKKNASK
jgi:S-adenosylmethionine hydrolase